MKNIKNVLLLLLTALIWGIAFVAQTTGGDAVGPYSFNCVRSFIGAGVLIPVIRFLDAKGYSASKPQTKEEVKYLWKAGLSCGVFLFLGMTFQQLGIFMGTPAGKAGFLTACYIVLVPVLGIFLKKKCGLNIWIAVAITVVGLYMLCMNETLNFKASDIFVLVCALAYAFQIMSVDKYVNNVDPIRLSRIQFLVAGTLSIVPTIIYDIKVLSGSFSAWIMSFTTWDAWIPILYAGVMSCGVAYTLQIVGQRGFNPTIASLLMSLESVFSVLAGWVILGQKLGPKELAGCALIFVAVVLAQISFDNFKKKPKEA